MNSETEPMSPAEHLLLEEEIESRLGLSYAARDRETLEARLRPRLQRLHLRRYYDYYLHLQYDMAGELPLLAAVLTNNETYFFRETYQFEGLFGEGLEQLELFGGGRRIRISSAGCSSGEEPYTLGFFARDYQRSHPEFDYHIDAFDLDNERIEIANAATYGAGSLRNTTPEQAARYFASHEGEEPRHALRPEYREDVSFRTGNILDATSFGLVPYDVIFCRNVLIYFSDGAFHRAIENFARALRPGGLLFLGHSESLIGRSTQFETVRLDRCIAYRRGIGT
ncbi:MAG: protein-glutamate O-methyltransferase CheR [Thermoanaerobaculia bacterium]|nr:protein-glutamate O-methyltransferase CheR [Thermoanaerobaculia bacterium]